MERKIPLARPDITEAEIEAVVEVLRSGVLSIGPRVQEFEERIKKFTGRRHAVAVNSGTSGLHLLIRAYGIGEGDEVITTSFSFVASANCILFERAKPVFVDIDPSTYNLDVSLIEEKITPRTKAILPVDVFGQPVDMEAIMEIARRYGLVVIEDSCEAIGSKRRGKLAGTAGDAGVYAFYPNKQMTTAEGGVIVTDDDRVAELCRSMRSQGRAVTGTWLHHERLGYNYRMSELHAALGVVQLKRLPEFIRRRQEVANRYRELLAGVEGVVLPAVAEDVEVMSWFVYVVRFLPPLNRDRIMEYLLSRGIECKPYFPPIHLQPFYRELGYREGDLPVTEEVARQTLALPFYNHLTREEQEYVAEEVKKAVSLC